MRPRPERAAHPPQIRQQIHGIRDPIIRIRVGPIIHIPGRTQMQIGAVTLQLRQQDLRMVQVIPKPRRIHRRDRREPRRLIEALLTLRGLDFRRCKVARLIDRANVIS